MAFTRFTTEVAKRLVANGYREAVLLPLGDMPRSDVQEIGWKIIPFREEWEAQYYFDNLDDETMLQSCLLEILRAAEELCEIVSEEDRSWLFVEDMSRMLDWKQETATKHATHYPSLN